MFFESNKESVFMGMSGYVKVDVSIDVLYSFRCIMAGSHKFVFLVRGHVVLVAVAYTQESVTQVQCSFAAFDCIKNNVFTMYKP